MAAVGCHRTPATGPQPKGESAMTAPPPLSAAEQARVEAVAVQYLTDEKKWQPHEYRLEPQGVSADGSCAIVWAVWLEDEKKLVPGPGESLELHIDRTRQRVAKEYG